MATGDYISGLQIVISDKELDEKRERLGLINRYLETTSEIESVHDFQNDNILEGDGNVRRREERRL